MNADLIATMKKLQAAGHRRGDVFAAAEQVFGSGLIKPKKSTPTRFPSGHYQNWKRGVGQKPEAAE